MGGWIGFEGEIMMMQPGGHVLFRKFATVSGGVKRGKGVTDGEQRRLLCYVHVLQLLSTAIQLLHSLHMFDSDLWSAVV